MWLDRLVLQSVTSQFDGFSMNAHLFEIMRNFLIANSIIINIITTSIVIVYFGK